MERLMRTSSIANDLMSPLSLLERLRWNSHRVLNRLIRRYGVLGTTSLLLLLLCVLSALVLAELENKRATLAETLLLQKTQALSADRLRRQQVGRVDTDEQRLQAFEKKLLSQSDLHTEINQLLTLAQQHRLSTERGEYRIQEELLGGFTRFKMNLPVVGRSGDVRRFIYEAMLEQEALAIEGAQFQRENTHSDQLEARLQWVIFMKSPPAPVEAKL